MILIFTIKEDGSTYDICFWLRKYKQDFILINEDSNIIVEDFEISTDSVEFALVIDYVRVKYSEIKSIWFRKGNFKISQNTNNRVKINESDELENTINNYLTNEAYTFGDYIKYLLHKKRVLGDSFLGDINKLYSLHKAKEAGLNIPKTIVSSQKRKLKEVFKTHNDIITKSISNFPMMFVNNENENAVIMGYTEKINKNKLNEFPDEFFVSKFQVLIEKVFEIRAFYLNGEIYSMAIFSQLDSKTSLDFRRYNYQKPNRNVPFKLPKEIERKIKNYMKSVKLNTGSIDLIYTKNKEYVFLEMNPVGQFGMVSYPCNYKIERKIAEFLMK